MKMVQRLVSLVCFFHCFFYFSHTFYFFAEYYGERKGDSMGNHKSEPEVFFQYNFNWYLRCSYLWLVTFIISCCYLSCLNINLLFIIFLVVFVIFFINPSFLLVFFVFSFALILVALIKFKEENTKM